ncbi:alpha/beta hydrolase [Corallococcus sp. M34]|uniref:alpha/beta fold hydrolase n=1 Tax=Citreicoccus inhibens TaxID=2849499 RepID=UPI0013159756|nr:alpha/beta hydrolase [Citreicoccus inhibens]MBU8897978.1 alpha/beta hydrolase [Citreicoccus inhibens]
MKSKVVEGPQGRLSVREAGADGAPPVVLLHADSGRASQWQEVQLRLGREYRAVALDFRGSGESEPARDGDYGYGGRAADLGSVADALGLKRFVLVAHSGGGAVALEYAAHHAERVAGLFLVDPPTDPRALPQAVRDGFVAALKGPDSLAFQQDYFRSIAGADPVVRERVVVDCAAVAPACRAGVGAALAEWNPEPTLKAWQGPFFILASAANDNANALYRLRADVPHQVLSDTGHWLQLEQPAMVEDAIRRFLAGLESEAP